VDVLQLYLVKKSDKTHALRNALGEEALYTHEQMCLNNLKVVTCLIHPKDCVDAALQLKPKIVLIYAFCYDQNGMVATDDWCYLEDAGYWFPKDVFLLTSDHVAPLLTIPLQTVVIRTLMLDRTDKPIALLKTLQQADRSVYLDIGTQIKKSSVAWLTETPLFQHFKLSQTSSDRCWNSLRQGQAYTIIQADSSIITARPIQILNEDGDPKGEMALLFVCKPNFPPNKKHSIVDGFRTYYVDGEIGVGNKY